MRGNHNNGLCLGRGEEATGRWMQQIHRKRAMEDGKESKGSPWSESENTGSIELEKPSWKVPAGRFQTQRGGRPKPGKNQD